MRIFLVSIAGVCCVAALACAPAAHAADIAFAGTWATEPSQCANDQSKTEAPLILTATTYDQHESHCTFGSVVAKGDTWQVKAKCTVEGDSQDGEFEFTVDGDTLVISDEGGRRVLTRCH
jgi:hypothetical protein